MRKNANTRPAIFSHVALLLAVVTLGGLALLGGARPASAVVTTIQLSQASYSTPEGSTIQIGVSCSSGCAGAGVQLAVVGGGTGVQGVNYSTVLVTSSDLSITPLSFVTLDDGGPNGSKTVNLLLQNPTGGATLGAQTTAQLTITDIHGPQPATISSVSPHSGPTGGTNTVTINGSNFTGTPPCPSASLTFGGTPATGCSISATQITATAPAHGAGTVDIVVNNGNGANTNTSADDYTYGAGPVVYSLGTTSGPIGGGTSVVITGKGFTGIACPAGVTFGGTQATSCTFNSDTSVTATAPAHAAGNADVIVTVAAVPSPNTVDDNYTYTGSPSISYLSPTSGTTAGGTTVIIYGSNLIGAYSVTFDGFAAGIVDATSNSSITVTTPVHVTPGTVTVVAYVTAGVATAPSAYTYTSGLTPVVSSISPNFGPVTGATYVTITGANFIPAGSTVYFGATPATPSTTSANTITVFSPAHIAGTVDVTVQTVNGTSATSYADLFSYGGLSGLNVTSLSPNGGPPTGGTIVAITGTGFLSGVTCPSGVTFGGYAALSCVVNSDYSITATAPAHALGTVDVIVSNGSVFSPNTLADNYTYTTGPTITSINPTTGPSSGGTIVTLTGTGFTGVTSVYFGGVNAPTFGVTSATGITVVAPPGSAGVVDITVTGPGGTSPTSLADQYTYTGASVPVVTMVSPSTGAAAGGTSVTITGSGFTGATAVTFGGTSASFTFVSDSTITATAPAHANGTVHIIVTGPGGSSSATSADNFTYTGASATTTYTLSFRWTIIVWLGQDGASAMTMLQGSSSAGTNNVSTIVTAIFRWDASGQAWQAFFTSGAGIPGANDFTTLTKGQAYFIAVTSATSWTVTIG